MKEAQLRENQRRVMSATAGFVIMILGWAGAAQAQMAVHGAGTANTIPVWTSSATQGNSVMKQSGGNINVTGGLTTTGPISAPSLSGNGSGVTNVNAATLGGVLPSAFAKLAAPNIFTADQNINGNLNLGSNLTLGGSINNALTLQGNVIGAFGDQGANVIGGFSGSVGFPGNSVGNTTLGATIAGGGGALYDGTSVLSVPNIVTARWGTVGGGFNNTAGNNVSSQVTAATVAGGEFNTASGDNATVSGGNTNAASGTNATVPGGNANVATGFSSFAAGSFAQANNDHTFVWSDGSAVTSDTGPKTFVALASGGFTFYTAPGTSAGATLAAGSGSWSMLSDKNTKSNFSAVDGQSLLAKLATLPISTWNYKAQPDSVRHMGPTAQDFRAAFGLGEDERHISTVDAQGVTLAAIQALYETVVEEKQQIVELRARLAHLEQHQ